MSENNIEKFENEINIHQILELLWNGKYVVIFTTVFTVALAVGISIYLPNVYRTEVLLFPVDDENSTNTNGLQLGQLGSLASLAGVDLNQAGSSLKIKGIATLQSRAFITEFLNSHELIVPFMASIPGDRDASVQIDPSIYDVESGEWIRKVSPPMQIIPSDWEVYDEFSKILNVDEDDETGLITVSLEWYDPNQIRIWLDWLIEDVNERMKIQDLNEAERAIDYLEGQLERTQLVEMRNMFFNLIQQQTQTIMLADVRDGYVFQIIDPPVVPQEHSSPNRAVIILLGFILGVVLSLFWVFNAKQK